MALVQLRNVDWTLTDKRQDIRGRELRDAVGRTLGTILHMIVDTEQERVVTVQLSDGTEYPADDLQIMEDAVYFIPPEASASEEEPVASPSVPEESPATDEETPAADPSIASPDLSSGVADPAIPSPPDAAETPDESTSAEPKPHPAAAIPPPALTESAEDPAIPSAPDPQDELDEEPAPAAPPQAPGAYLEVDFKNHFEAEYEDRRLRYGDLQFAYRFGFDASKTPRLAERELNDVEADLRRVFYARFNYPASDELVWAVAGDAVRYGFRLGRR